MLHVYTFAESKPDFWLTDLQACTIAQHQEQVLILPASAVP